MRTLEGLEYREMLSYPRFFFEDGDENGTYQVTQRKRDNYDIVEKLIDLSINNKS